MSTVPVAVFERLATEHAALSQISDRSELISRLLSSAQLRRDLADLGQAIRRDGASALPDDAASVSKLMELRVSLLVSLVEDEQREEFQRIQDEIITLLTAEDGRAAPIRGAGELTTFLIMALGVLNEGSRDELIRFLGSLTGRQEGSLQRIDPGLRLRGSSELPHITNLLELGLASEVIGFLDLVGRADLRLEPRATDTGQAVACTVSRKGGVGKSTVVLGIVLSALLRDRTTRICVLDLDFRGPTWQYLLLPDGVDSRGRGAADANLNQLIDLAQSDENFEFKTPAAADVHAACLEARIPFLDSPISLLGFQDLPRTNRFLTRQIANHPRSYRQFLDGVIAGLADTYDLVLIDNSPGFDYHTQIAYAAVAASSRGCPIVVSSPLTADLRGVFLELSDLKFLGARRTPAWIVNKTRSADTDFFKNVDNAVDIALQIPTFRRLMPEMLVLRNLLPVTTSKPNIYKIPFDKDLATTEVNLTGTGLLTSEGVEAYLNSKAFEALNVHSSAFPIWEEAVTAGAESQ